MGNFNLPDTEELDFHYLLELMRPIHDIPEFEWLPELFSTIDAESFLNLCKYAGGESIRIPTLEELQESISALRCFYETYITHSRDMLSIPERYQDLVNRIREVYDARENGVEDQ